jgi:hypothetical protein
MNVNLNHAVVHVITAQYEGPAVVLHSNGDDTVTVREEVSGHEFRVHKEHLEVASVTEQSEAWISAALLEAWQPLMRRLTRHIAQRLQAYGRFGDPEQVEALFHCYLTEPERLFRELRSGVR